MIIAGGILIFIGTLFSMLSGLGVLRMPDLYNRLQAGTKASTLGVISIALGGAFLMPDQWAKFLLIAVFVAATNPISSSYLARIKHKEDGEGTSALLKKDQFEEKEGVIK